VITWCAHPGCNVIKVTVGAELTSTCYVHAGKRPPVETPAERIERICRELGFRRFVQR
jgi:hypothetical protein